MVIQRIGQDYFRKIAHRQKLVGQTSGTEAITALQS
jgi:hypothetical protein